MNRPYSAPIHALPPRAHGATLVELMVAIAIGLLMLTALAALFAYNSNARGEIDRTSQQIENGRYGLEVLRDDIHQAGFFAGYDGSNAGAVATKQTTAACVPSAVVPLNAANLGWQASPLPPLMPLSIYGYAGGDLPGAEDCITNQKSNTDVLIIRRVESEPLAVATVAGYADDYFMQISGCADATVDPPPTVKPFVVAIGGSTAPFTLHTKDCTALTVVRKIVVRAYYIATCSVCSGAGDGIPTLRMVELTGGATTNIPLVEGIDSMRVEYSIDNDANGTIDAAKRCKVGTDDCSLADWSNVMAVQVRLLARNLTKTIDYSDAKTYDMGLAGTISAPNDGYKRHLYSALVIASNQAGPREQ